MLFRALRQLVRGAASARSGGAQPFTRPSAAAGVAGETQHSLLGAQRPLGALGPAQGFASWRTQSRGLFLGTGLLAASGIALRPVAAAASLSTAAGGAWGGAWGPSVIDQVTFKQMGMLSWLIVDFAINWAGWALAAALKTEVFYDALGSASFLTLSLGSLLCSQAPHTRKYVFTACVAAWALRLGSFLIARVVKTGHDSRFDKAKNEPGTFFVYWTMQAVWVYVTLLPLLLLNAASLGGPARIIWSDVVGAVVFGTGLVLETTADTQKFLFKSDPANAGRFIDQGLWSLSRYPNYFGEMCIWWGIFVGCSAGLSGAQFASVASPLFVMSLLLFVSGVPLQEKQAQARWGSTQEYQDYAKRTNLLIPLPKLGLWKAE